MGKETDYKKLENKAREQSIKIQVKKKIRQDEKVERWSESGKVSGRR